MSRVNLDIIKGLKYIKGKYSNYIFNYNIDFPNGLHYVKGKDNQGLIYTMARVNLDVIKSVK